MGNRRRLASIVGVVAALAALGWLCVHRGDELAPALQAVPMWAFAAVVVLHTLTLVARSEAWRLSLAAVEDRVPPRRAVHGANAGAFLIGAVDSHGALPVRIVLLRRLAPTSAPKPMQIAVADVPIFLLEVCTTALLLAIATAIGPLLLVGALLALLAGHRVCPRLRGLGVLADPRRRAGLVTWVVLITALALARTAVALHAAGLDAHATDVALTCATIGVLGLLPLGPSAAPAATMAAAGSGASALAAGLVVAAGALVAVAAYALVVVALLVAVRQTALSDGGSRCSSLRRSAARWVRSGSTSSSA